MFRFVKGNLQTLQDFAEAGAEARKQPFEENVEKHFLQRMIVILCSLCSSTLDMRSASTAE